MCLCERDQLLPLSNDNRNENQANNCEKDLKQMKTTQENKCSSSFIILLNEVLFE